MTTTASHHHETSFTARRGVRRTWSDTPTFQRAEGRLRFRNGLARDLAFLIDLDRTVDRWGCLPGALELTNADGEVQDHVPDFWILKADRSREFWDTNPPEGWIAEPGTHLVHFAAEDVQSEPRRTNAREMARYARRSVSLADRVRLLAWLEEASSLPLVEAATAMRESPEPIGAVIALALRRFVHVDWEERPIGPETIVRTKP